MQIKKHHVVLSAHEDGAGLDAFVGFVLPSDLVDELFIHGVCNDPCNGHVSRCCAKNDEPALAVHNHTLSLDKRNAYIVYFSTRESKLTEGPLVAAKGFDDSLYF